MRSHTFYIACSYLALAVAIIWELWSLRRLRAASLRKVRDEQALELEALADATAPSSASATDSPDDGAQTPRPSGMGSR